MNADAMPEAGDSGLSPTGVTDSMWLTGPEGTHLVPSDREECAAEVVAACVALRVAEARAHAALRAAALAGLSLRQVSSLTGGRWTHTGVRRVLQRKS